jgi:YaiO family outer membrane protein
MAIRILFICYTVIICSQLSGQQNIDSVFSAAINNAKEKEYNHAIQNAKKAISLDSSRYDIILFLANVYAWNKDYEKAKSHLITVYTKKPQNAELYNSWLNILLWNKEYSELLKTISIAQSNGYSNIYNIALKKALAFQGLNQFNSGINYLKQNSQWLDSTSIKNIYHELLKASNRNIISAYFSLDLFKNNAPKPHYLAYIDYSIARKKTIYILRLNYANRYKKEDLQPEIDIYHIFDNNHYLYANYGFGIKNELFPHHRFGLEYFAPLSNAFEISGGGKVFIYPNTNAYVITGHVGKYLPNIWLSLRPYYTLKDGCNSFASLYNMRLYHANNIGYWGLELGYGNSPDDRATIIKPEESIWLSSYRIKLEKNFSFSGVTELRLGTGYAYEEISVNNYRYRLIIEAILKLRF